MELYQLKTFKMVAEVGHLTKASKRLYTSQPAVSAHIKSLEDELGVQLFVRSPRGMVLTGNGVELKSYADQILAMADDMVSFAKVLQSKVCGQLRIGLNSESDVLRVAQLYQTLSLENPGIKLSFLQSSSGEVLNNLEEDRIDAGFIYGSNESDKIETVFLQEFELVVAGGISLPGAFETCSPEELNTYPWITTPADCPFHTVLKQLFKKYDLSPKEIMLADQEPTINTMVKSGAGLGLMLKNDVDKTAGQFRVWQRESLSLQLSIAYLKRRREEPVIQQLLVLLQSIWSLERTSISSC